MKSNILSRDLCLALVCLGSLSEAVFAASPPAPMARLGARLRVIESAVAEQRVEPLMQAALARELFQSNSPQEPRWNAAGQVQVYMHYDRYGAPPSGTALRALGATDIVVSSDLGLVQAWVPALQLNAIAALPEVVRVTIPRYAYVKRAPREGGLPRAGSVDTQGDEILGAAAFRQTTGFTGQGLAVGVLSNGAAGVSTDQGTGDLPAGSAVWIDPNYSGSGAEGTAIMEIIYDLAPGVKQFGFCAPQTTVDFVTCLNDLANKINPAVIVDDLGFAGVAMFADGGFALAVQQFAEAHPAIQLVSAAGNDATAFWSGAWDSKPVSVTVNGVSYTQAQNFGSAPIAAGTGMSFQVQPGDTASWVVEWNDPWVDTSQVTGGTPNDSNDYDVVLFDSQGNALACNQGFNLSSTNGACSQPNTQPLNSPGPQPVQGNQWQNTGTTAAIVYLDIFYVQDSSPATRQFKVLVTSQASNQIVVTPNAPAGSIFGQSALPYPYEITVGAIDAVSAEQGQYPIETYSSQGPVTLDFPTPVSRVKPDFTGVDCVSVTGVGGFGSPFCGTSAAAPHIAGLIALLESGYPTLNPYQLLQIGSRNPDSPSPNNTYGYGLPYLPAVASTYPPPTVSISGPAAGVVIDQIQHYSGTCSANGVSGSVSYSWNFGASANPATSTSQDPSVTFNTVGAYTISLTCTNGIGSTGVATRSVSVSQPSSGGGGGTGAASLALLAILCGGARRRQPGGLSRYQGLRPLD